MERSSWRRSVWNARRVGTAHAERGTPRANVRRVLSMFVTVRKKVNTITRHVVSLV